MKIVRSRTGSLSGLLAAVAVLGAADTISAQQTTMPSTLRYGSGYLDVPTATVIPHLAILGTFSGFWVDVAADYETNAQGQVIGVDPTGRDDFFGDGSVTLGLFDRAEVGATLQSFNDEDMGGNIVGAFGRIQLIKPRTEGIGLAGGVRYLSGPDYGDNAVEVAPNRLGFPDPRFREDLDDGDGADVETDLTVYGVATAYFRGPEDTFLPNHDFSFSIGLGNGLFSDGEKMEWYRYVDSEGVFAAASVAFELGDEALLHLMGEWNGFDSNVGVQLDLGGIRIGGHWLGVNYLNDRGIYRSDKFGVLGSLALCPTGDTFLCKPSLMARPVPDTVRLPAPPPDTVVVEREIAAPLPTGTPTTICLATGEEVQVLVTAQGDTLVGPNRISIRTLRPGVVFAGDYAAGRSWFTTDQPITFEQRQYLKSGGEIRLSCPDLMRVGEYMGVPLFARRNATRPFETLYVPVRPGVWQAYQTDLRRTRGD